MEHLPTELLELIVEECEFASLKALRLSNKRSCLVATSHVFQGFHMGLFQYSLEKLRELAKSRLAAHVKSFTFHSDILPDWSYEKWKVSIDFRPGFAEYMKDHRLEDPTRTRAPMHRMIAGRHYSSLPKHGFTESELREAYQKYRRIRESQVAWREDCESLVVKEMFAMLPNVRSVAVVIAGPFHGKNNIQPVWQGLRKEIFVGPDDWVLSSDSEPQEVQAQLAYKELASLTMLEAIGYRRCFWGVAPVASLRVHSGRRISYRDLMGATYGRGASPTIPSHGSRFNTMLQGFGGLTQIHLNLAYDTYNRDDDGKVVTELAAMLREAPALRELDLAARDDREKPFEEPEDLDLLGKLMASPPPWEHLEVLKLELNTTERSLVALLHRSAPSLRTLELRDCAVKESTDSWASVLSQIPTLLQLQTFYFECLWEWGEADGSVCYFEQGTKEGSPHNAAFEGFMLHRGGVMPDLDIESWEQQEFNEAFERLRTTADRVLPSDH